MNLKEFACLDKNYLTLNERKASIIIYSLLTISTVLLSLVLKIEFEITIGIIFLEGIITTLILYWICKMRINPNENKCEGI